MCSSVLGSVTEACPLCQAEKLTHWFEETDLYWIALCKTCNVPMAVLKRHDIEITPTEWATAIGALRRVAMEFFGDELWYFDKCRRQVPDHWHVHTRVRR